MSRSLLMVLLVVMILLAGLPLIMTAHASHCAACPDGDVAVLLWGCLAVLITIVGVTAGSALETIANEGARQHNVLIVDRLDRPPHAP